MKNNFLTSAPFSQLYDALRLQRQNDRLLGTCLLSLGYISAERLLGNHIFSWKPQPMHLVGHFDEECIRCYIRHTIDVAQANGCVLEMILKDTHTCEHEPERFDRWLQIARGEVEWACGERV